MRLISKPTPRHKIARSHYNNDNLEQALIKYNNAYQLNDKARNYFYECAPTLYLQQSSNHK